MTQNFGFYWNAHILTYVNLEVQNANKQSLTQLLNHIKEWYMEWKTHRESLIDYNACLTYQENSTEGLYIHNVLLRKSLLQKKYTLTMNINELKLKLKTALKFHQDRLKDANLIETNNYHEFVQQYQKD